MKKSELQIMLELKLLIVVLLAIIVLLIIFASILGGILVGFSKELKNHHPFEEDDCTNRQALNILV